MTTVIDVARAQLGTPYVWGGEAPGGFDCSGLVKYCFAQLGVLLPHYTDAIAGQTSSVPEGQQAAGDLILYRYNDPSQPGTVYPHMGIVEAPGLTIDAAYPAGCTEHAPFSYAHEYRRASVPAQAAAPVAVVRPAAALGVSLPNLASLALSPFARLAAVSGLALLTFAYVNPSPWRNPRRLGRAGFNTNRVSGRCPVCRNPDDRYGCDPSRRFCAFWSGPPGHRVLRPIRASAGYDRDVERAQSEARREAEREHEFAGTGRARMAESGIERPPAAWARGLSLAALARIARDAGVSPYEYGWWDSANLIQGGREMQIRQGVGVEVARRRSGEYKGAILEGGHHKDVRRAARTATGRPRDELRRLSPKQRAEQRAHIARLMQRGADLPF